MNNKRATLKKISNITLIAVQAIIMVVCIVFSVISIINNSKGVGGELREGINVMPVLSDSMSGDQKDSFNQGDLIIVATFGEGDRANLKVGDIITFKKTLNADGYYVYNTHRIVEITDTTIVTQGDKAKTVGSNEKEEHRINSSDIVGIYKGKLAGVGKTITFLQKPIIFFFLIVAPLLLLLIYNVVIIIRATLSHKYKQIEEKNKLATEQAIAAAIAQLQAQNNNSQSTTNAQQVDSDTSTDKK